MSKINSIGIYGCSFADPYWAKDSQIQHFSWSKLLENDYSRVDNFAIGGSSVYYSYKKFLETHEKYDKIIFSITSSGRWFKPFYFHGYPTFINSIPSLNLRKRQYKKDLKRNPELLRKLDALEKYYLELEDEEVSDDIRDLILFKVKNLRQDTLFIPFKFWENVHQTFLRNFSQKDQDKVHSLNYFDYNLVCHLPEEYNREIYSLIKFCLETRVSWNYTNFTRNVPIQHEFSYYYKQLS